MRGEYALLRSSDRVYSELPPRARRILFLKHFIINRNGTTSACAENTLICPHPCPILGNYLRVRGEYIAVTKLSRWSLELPPRARRILSHACGVLGKRGTTSACAENTHSNVTHQGKRWNYLRVRGEYEWTMPLDDCPEELPPRARRIRPSRGTAPQRTGTTSACAENTAILFLRIG